MEYCRSYVNFEIAHNSSDVKRSIGTLKEHNHHYVSLNMDNLFLWLVCLKSETGCWTGGLNTVDNIDPRPYIKKQ